MIITLLDGIYYQQVKPVFLHCGKEVISNNEKFDQELRMSVYITMWLTMSVFAVSFSVQ